MQFQRVTGAICVHAAWITAFLVAVHLIILFVISWFKAGKIEADYMLWALIFAGLGVGVLNENRRSARWLVGVQGFWVARIALDVFTGFPMPLYYLMFFAGGLVVSIAGAMHLRRTFKETEDSKTLRKGTNNVNA